MKSQHTDEMKYPLGLDGGDFKDSYFVEIPSIVAVIPSISKAAFRMSVAYDKRSMEDNSMGIIGPVCIQKLNCYCQGYPAVETHLNNYQNLSHSSETVQQMALLC